MLRYKNSLLERILLEKGRYLHVTIQLVRLLTPVFKQASMCKQNFV